MLQWGDSIFLLLLGEKNPCSVYPAPRQSKSREESLQPAVVGLDYKIVGDFFLLLFSEQLTVNLIDEFCYQ